MTTKKKYFQYLDQFRDLSPEYRIKGGYRKAQHDFVEGAQIVQSDIPITADDLKVRLPLKYLAERYKQQHEKAKSYYDERLQKISKAGETYVMFRQNLDKIKYKFYILNPGYFTRPPKAYKEFKPKNEDDYPITFTMTDLQKVKDKLAKREGKKTSTSTAQQAFQEFVGKTSVGREELQKEEQFKMAANEVINTEWKEIELSDFVFPEVKQGPGSFAVYFNYLESSNLGPLADKPNFYYVMFIRKKPIFLYVKSEFDKSNNRIVYRLRRPGSNRNISLLINTTLTSNFGDILDYLNDKKYYKTNLQVFDTEQ